MSLRWVSIGTVGEQGVADLEVLCWQSYIIMVQPWGLHCPCGPSVTAAVGPGRLSPLDLVLTLPPDSSSSPTAEEDVQEETGRGQDYPEGAGPMAACMAV